MAKIWIYTDLPPMQNRPHVSSLWVLLMMRRFGRSFLLALLLTLGGLSQAQACSDSLPSWAQAACNRLDEIWNDGSTSIYASGYAWHNRWTYKPSKIRSFNEKAWGGGIGRTLYDEDGDLHALYLMGFRDSHRNLETIGGYGFEKIANLSENTRVGAGYTVFLTSRQDIANYIPFPGILPLVSVGYKRATLFATYIPGTRGNGNVLFVFGSYTF